MPEYRSTSSTMSEKPFHPSAVLRFAEIGSQVIDARVELATADMGKMVFVRFAVNDGRDDPKGASRRS